MGEKKPNETTLRLDRLAARLRVVSYRKCGVNSREFTLPSGRVIKFKPGGKGVLRVTALDWSEMSQQWVADAECVTSKERLERILAQASTLKA